MDRLPYDFSQLCIVHFAVFDQPGKVDRTEIAGFIRKERLLPQGFVDSITPAFGVGFALFILSRI